VGEFSTGIMGIFAPALTKLSVIDDGGIMGWWRGDRARPNDVLGDRWPAAVDGGEKHNHFGG
jgi:hypothetical protein